MPARTLLVALAIGAVACTGGTSSRDTTSSVPTVGGTAPPTSNVDVKLVPGVWTYELRGLKATFTWKDGPPTLAVDNRTGIDVGAPAVYVVTQDQKHVDGSLDGSAPLADGASGTYTVTFPADLTRDDVGLVVLELGDENWGALAPKVIEGGS
jgi:hypothetical protein